MTKCTAEEIRLVNEAIFDQLRGPDRPEDPLLVYLAASLIGNCSREECERQYQEAVDKMAAWRKVNVQPAMDAVSDFTRQKMREDLQITVAGLKIPLHLCPRITKIQPMVEIPDDELDRRS